MRLKESRLESIDNKWKTSEVERIDLKEVSSQDFAKKLMLERKYSYEVKSMMFDESQFK